MISTSFPEYKEFFPLVPVWCVTPHTGRCIHRFFDTSPFSPSGRYLVVLRMPKEDSLPRPGEIAEIVLIDLKQGHEKVVAETRGWESQLGANINWGQTDDYLYFNDVNTKNWQPYSVQLNLNTGKRKVMEGTIYQISPDGEHIISASLHKMRRTQDGYGVILPSEFVQRNRYLSEDDGLFITSTKTGKKKLLISIKRIFEILDSKINNNYLNNMECYGFHCKFNPQGTRILFTLRWFDRDEENPWNMEEKGIDYLVLTMSIDGSDVQLAVGPEQWRKIGHHINWFPDGKRLSMNLRIDGDNLMYFVQVNQDGTNLRKIAETVQGSGHPTVHPDGNFILTDAYTHESVSKGDGTVPIRWINLHTEKEEVLLHINVDNPGVNVHKALRVDPHPAWDRNYRLIAFNGFVNGSRRVFVADLSQKIQN